MASNALDGKVIIVNKEDLDFSDHNIKFQLNAHSEQEASGIDLTNDYLLCGTDNSAVGIWSLETGDIVLKLEGHRQGITDVRAVSDDLVVSASYDFTVRMWSK